MNRLEKRAPRSARSEKFRSGSKVLDQALLVAPRRRAEAQALVRRVHAGRHDSERIVDAGHALEELARGRRHRALGHATLGELLLSIGVTRSTAHRWRVLAKEASAGVERAAPRRRAAPVASAKSLRAAKQEARALARRLAARGVEATVTAISRDGVAAVRIELDVQDAKQLG